MKRSVTLENSTLGYTLRLNRRARHLRLAVHGDGAVVISAPPGLPAYFIDRLIAQKSQWVQDKLEYFKQFPVVKSVAESRSDYLRYKKQARLLVLRRLEYFNAFYGFDHGRVSIRNQRTRWGSCSSKCNLNFNYKIAFLPDHQADYIIVHELCHVGEFNHSPGFWDLVCQTIPNHRAIRRELRHSGLSFY